MRFFVVFRKGDWVYKPSCFQQFFLLKTCFFNSISLTGNGFSRAAKTVLIERPLLLRCLSFTSITDNYPTQYCFSCNLFKQPG